MSQRSITNPELCLVLTLRIGIAQQLAGREEPSDVLFDGRVVRVKIGATRVALSMVV
jgi:hypothetical protein